MKKISLFLLYATLLFMSCSHSGSEENDREARELFNKSEALLKEYIIKLKTASDSIAVDSLFDSYDKRVTEINFSVSAMTDLKLNEQENDSLYKLINELQQTRSERLRNFDEVYKANFEGSIMP